MLITQSTNQTRKNKEPEPETSSTRWCGNGRVLTRPSLFPTDSFWTVVASGSPSLSSVAPRRSRGVRRRRFSPILLPKARRTRRADPGRPAGEPRLPRDCAPPTRSASRASRERGPIASRSHPVCDSNKSISAAFFLNKQFQNYIHLHSQRFGWLDFSRARVVDGVGWRAAIKCARIRDRAYKRIVNSLIIK